MTTALLGTALAADLHTPTDHRVELPLRMLNRHGLIAGATGTGKTKTLQRFAEQLSTAGVPVLLADLKGDLSGLSQPGTHGSGWNDTLGLPFTPQSFPVRFMTLSPHGRGDQLRIPLHSFGPLLLAKVLDATRTQEQALQVLFVYAQQRGLPLDTLVDLTHLLNHLSHSGDASAELGISTATLGVLRRSVLVLAADGMTELFGQPAFDVQSLMQNDASGRGVINIVDAQSVQTQPRLFAAFTMWMLRTLYETSPEVGDADLPRLAFFFDEAHMLFEGASKPLVEQVRMTVRMARSKGLGVFFVTQQATDIPDSILSQLATRVQHALRAFTPKDQQALRATAQTFPVNDGVDVHHALTSMGTGEALVTGLTTSGEVMPTVVARIGAPESSMDPLPAPPPVPAVASTRTRTRLPRAVPAKPRLRDRWFMRGEVIYAVILGGPVALLILAAVFD